MPMLCATMSCNSRAIRSRSVTTAWAAACAPSCSAWSRDCRVELPMNQATTAVSVTASSVEVPMWKPTSSRTAANTTTVTTAWARAVSDVRRERAAATTQRAMSTGRNCRKLISDEFIAIAPKTAPAANRTQAGSAWRCSRALPATVTRRAGARNTHCGASQCTMKPTGVVCGP